MGRAAFATLLVWFVLVGGCAGGGPTARHSRQQWARVCARLRPAGADARVSALPAEPTAGEMARLLRHADRAAAFVVHVRTLVRRGAGEAGRDGDVRTTCAPSGGTGVVIAGDGLILTNEHVVREAVEVSVILPDGSCHRAECVAADERFDVAVLSIDCGGLAELTPAGDAALAETAVVAGGQLPGRAGGPAFGERVPPAGAEAQTPRAFGERVRPAGVRAETPVVAIGRPSAGVGVCLRPGVVTAARASLQQWLAPAGGRCYDGLVESTARLEAGFSGGPLLDVDGRLVGLNVAICGSGTGERAYALPLDSPVQRAVADLVRRVRAGRPATADR
ncbi:MAG: serine protease [Phycisphaerae bacterium]|jgi:S1-C subfamily serine protease